MSTLTQTIDNVGAAITEHIQPYLVDLMYDDFALFAIAEEMGRVKIGDPSRALSWPVVTGKLNTGTYAGAFRYPGLEKQIFDRAVLPWRNAYCDMVLSGPDVMRARGPYAAFELIKAMKQAGRMAIADETGKQIYNDGSGTDFDGSVAAIDDGVLYPSYANLPRSGMPTGWQAYVNGTVAAPTFPYLTTAIGKTRIGNSKVDLVTTTQDIWNEFQNRAQTQQQFGQSRAVNLGFETIRHMSTDIVHDAKCPDGHIFGFTMDQFEVQVMPDRMWSFTGFRDVPGADAVEAQYLLMGNFEFMAPRQYFKLYNVITS